MPGHVASTDHVSPASTETSGTSGSAKYAMGSFGPTTSLQDTGELAATLRMKKRETSVSTIKAVESVTGT